MQVAVDPALAPESQALCRFVLATLGELVRADGASVMLAEGDRLLIRASGSREGDPVAKLGLGIRIGERVAGKAAEIGETIIIVGDVSRDERFAAVRKYENILTGLACPLLRDGKCRGVLNLKRTSTAGTFSYFETDVVKIIARHLAAAL